jgi:hypothetical protein
MLPHHLRHAPPPVYYTETECLACTEIVAVAWHYQHANLSSPSSPLNALQGCPMCGKHRLETRLINQQAFEYITENWDLMVAGELEPSPSSGDENVIDLSNLFNAQGCEGR